MFETAKLERKVSRKEFARREPELRERLLDAQFQLGESRRRSLVLLVSGPEGAGKGEVVNRLLEWMDARGILAHALGDPTSEERERPALYRFWHRLPPLGKIAIFSRTWYAEPINLLAQEQIGEAEFERSMRRIVEFERMLSAENVRLVKVALYITKKQQRKRFEKLESDPNTAWRVTRDDWKQHRAYDEFERASAVALRRTSIAEAPWKLIAAKDTRYRDLAVAEALLAALETALAEPEAAPVVAEPVPEPESPNLIDNLDLSKRADPDTYQEELERLQARLGRRSRELARAERSVVAVFEGPDAAGKGGAIRRVVQSLDARSYRVTPISAPTDEEAALPYLWRFWRHLPGYGRFGVFDRSWYGRVLVERVEGLAAPEDWKRAYEEITAFEEQLVDAGAIVLKFWIAISREEQLRRFEGREATGYKRHKITADDWRNREKWSAYVTAACDMIERTSTELAPWTLVAGEDKRFARLEVLRTFVSHIEEAVE
jgi:polyphosphate:AMP phosphotransferase